MKGPIALGLVLVAAAGGFAAGRFSLDMGDEPPSKAPQGEGPSGAPSSEGRGAVPEPPKKQIDDRTKRPRADPNGRGSGGESGGSSESVRDSEPAPESPPSTTADVPVPAIDLTKSAAENSKRFMAYAEAQLARGPEGYDSLLRAIDGLAQNKDAMNQLFTDEADAVREAYPWLRLMVKNESHMVDLTEHTFRRMAETPEFFASFGTDNGLELFTEGLGMFLPGVVDDERMARFRKYAIAILEASPDKLPKAVRGNRSDVERLLTRFWAERATPEAALAALKAGNVPPRDLLRLLKSVPAADLALIDVTALVLPSISAGNGAILRAIGAPPLDKLDAARIDQSLLEGMDTDRVAAHFAVEVLRRTGRKEWSAARPFVDRAFDGGETRRSLAAQMLLYLSGTSRPEKSWVEDVIARGLIPESQLKQIQSVFGIATK